MGEVKSLIQEQRDQLAAQKQELDELKNVMGSAPFNLSKDEVNSLSNNNKGGGKNANRGNNSKG